jgi:hypothetical protein
MPELDEAGPVAAGAAGGGDDTDAVPAPEETAPIKLAVAPPDAGGEDEELDAAEDDSAPAGVAEATAAAGSEPSEPAAAAGATPPADGETAPAAGEEERTTAALPQWRPRLRLSRLELVSLVAVAVAIVGASGWVLRTFFVKLPIRAARVELPTFPARGERATVKAATTYWRAPVRGGPNPDAARAEAKLIPVLKLTLADGDGRGALRVFFRNSQGEAVGDSVTRTFADGKFAPGGSPELEIAATTGFDDEGKHAAYLISEGDPWIAEVFEGPEERAPFETFRLLFKIPISTDRR